MTESLGVYRNLERGPDSPIVQVRTNQAVATELQGVIPNGKEPQEYLASRVGISTGEAHGTRESLRVISPTGKRTHTIRFFRPTLVGDTCFTSLTAKGVGIGDTSMEASEDLLGLVGRRSAARELKTSEGLQADGVRVSRVAATIPLNSEKLRRWLRSQPRGQFQLEQMLALLDGEQPEIVVRFDNPRLSDLFNARAGGPYSANSIARRGAQALYTEMDMSGEQDLLGTVYNYSRSQQARRALREVISSRPASPNALKEYLLLEAFFAGYNHMKLLLAGGRLQSVRAPQDILVGGAIFTDFENLSVLRGTTPQELQMQQQGQDFSHSFARMITQRGYKSLKLLHEDGDTQNMQYAFLEGFALAA